ncbi:MAG: hypothetical protein ACRER2_04125 [Methylococcales bacterium]
MIGTNNLTQIGNEHAWYSAVSKLMDPEVLFTELKSLASQKDPRVVDSLQLAIKDCMFLNNDGSYMDRQEFGRFIETLKQGMEWLSLSLQADNTTHSELDVLRRKLVSGNDRNGDFATWAAIRLFRLSPRVVKIPFVVVSDKLIKGIGLLCWLELQVLDNGLNRAIRHPIDHLRASLNAGNEIAKSSFEEAIQSAWSVAYRQSSISKSKTVMEGYWRLIVEDNELGFETIDGSSAGGAAISGWVHALKDTIPDEGLIVLATAPSDDSSELLGKVDGVKAKAEAVGKSGSFDTIVVADSDNHKEAVQGLKKAGFSLCGERLSAESSATYLSHGDQVIRVINLVHWSPPAENRESPAPP